MPTRTDCPEMYKAARAWKDAALLDNDSLFTPGQEIWSTEWLDELHERFVLGADDGRDPFLTKLERQLQDADPAAFQLMGELLYVHFLAAASVTKRTKRKNIETVLGWSPDPVSIPPTLEVALDQGVGGAGSGFNTYRYRLLRFLIEFTRTWKTMDSVDRVPIVTDHWKLRAFVEGIPGSSDGQQRNALLHLLHPETFERVMTQNHKQKIVKAYEDRVSNPSDDLDRMLLQIREALSEEYGENFSFYEDRLKEQWDGSNKKRKASDTLTPVPEAPSPIETPERGERALVTLSRLAWELHLADDSHLERIVNLLKRRRQVIFYGPPGTGKTYVARKLAPHPRLAGDEDRVDLVQFHPSYAYEDFVEGYRPTTLDDGMAGFELREGPLKRIARRAEEAADEEQFVLIIDEINRGNLGKVLGELYFLLEYRDARISLQYSADDFSLPKNLWIIGTMNTADRSIARIDSALRRRFHFVPFFPDEPPIKGLLSRWLARHKPEMAWVAEVLDRANEQLDRPHAAIGPSHFMHDYLDEEWVGMIWEHSVLPYIAEQYFGEEDRLEEFALDHLKSQVTVAADEHQQADGDGD